MVGEEHIPIGVDADVVTARTRAKDLAAALGFSPTDQTVIAAAVSEIARNIVAYAGAGELRLRGQRGARGSWGLEVVAHDEGPGIADVSSVLRQDYASDPGLGIG
ncbi:MAG TPA: ATP-binding protein, partial [Acidimicrobiales bacterium]|nr:ATP-binding protein [Acidimicrobiales bacterium]